LMWTDTSETLDYKLLVHTAIGCLRSRVAVACGATKTG
jgi:hypothetical protein